MAHTKSASKRARQAEKRRLKNRAEKSRIRTFRRKLRAAVAAGNKDVSAAIFRNLCSYLDKAVKHGVLKANTASRYKSRDAAVLNKLAKAGSTV